MDKLNLRCQQNEVIVALTHFNGHDVDTFNSIGCLDLEKGRATLISKAVKARCWPWKLLIRRVK